jgi:hypothetical protein
VKNTIEDRFWPKVDRSGGLDACWPWLGCRDTAGYGRLTVGSRKDGTKRPALAHRIAYELERGPLGTAFATHTCDNPACCNPSHVRAGTHASNMAEMAQRGRAARGDRSGPRRRPERLRRGERHGNAKLTAEAVADIRSSGEPQRVLAERHGVDRSVVSRVRSGEAWA